MKNKIPNNRKRKSRALFWLGSITAVLSGILTGVAILVWYSPAAYTPLTPENPQQVSLYLTHELGPEFVNQIQLNQPFELIIEQTGLNDIITRQQWPQQFGELSFADPVVFFSDPSILLMGTLKYKEVASVISITAIPVMDEQGRVCMNIESIRLGMLPVTSFIAKLVKNAVDSNQDYFEGDPELLSVIEAIIQNEYFEPAFWFFDYRIRVTDFSIEPGVLKLTLAPRFLTPP